MTSWIEPIQVACADGIERLRLTLHANDPSWLRLTQSLKTVLAVLLTMGIVYWLAPADLFLASVGAGFLMQCGEGVDRRRQQMTMLVCALAAITLAATGAMAGAHLLLRDILIVGVAFFTFYLRRFVPRRPGFTAYGFVLCILATVLPGGAEHGAQHALVLAVAAVVAFVVFFFIRPPDPPRAFAVGTRVFCSCTADLLSVLVDSSPALRAARYQHLVQRALRFNQALADSLQPGTETERINELLLGQYDVWQLLQMLEDSLGHLSPADAQRFPRVWGGLINAIAELASTFHLAGTAYREEPSTPVCAHMRALEEKLLRADVSPDASWVHFGGIVLAGCRLEVQAERLINMLGNDAEHR